MTEGGPISTDRSGTVRDTDALLFSQTQLAQATGDIHFVSNGKRVVEKPSEQVTDAIKKVDHPILREVSRYGSQSHVVGVPSSGVRDADIVALHSNIQ